VVASRSRRQQRALEAAVSVARAQGLPPSAPRVIADATNVLVHLAPLPVVAKVCTNPVRHTTDVHAREVAITSYLAHAGAPVAPPSHLLPPGPHHWGELELTFWRLVEGAPGTAADPAALGHSLRALHSALVDYPGDLPPFSWLSDLIASLLADPARLLDMPPEDRRFLMAALARLQEKVLAYPVPRRPLHGDAIVGNVLVTRDGPVWLDFEAACIGPGEWDLIGLPEEALSLFPETDRELLGWLRVLGSLYTCVWCWNKSGHSPKMLGPARFHLAFLYRERSRFGL
jgi:hypothetical protein